MSGGNTQIGVKSDADSNGDSVIGGSLRPDGTVRKTLKVRPGFIPLENRQRYSVREARERRLNEVKGSTEKSLERKEVDLGNASTNTDSTIQIPSDNKLKVIEMLSSKDEPSGEKKSSLQNSLHSQFNKLSINEDNSKPFSSKVSKDDEVESPKQTLSKPKYQPPRLRKKKYKVEDI